MEGVHESELAIWSVGGGDIMGAGALREDEKATR